MTNPPHTVDAATLPARPRLAADVSLHPPRAEGGPWVLERDGRQYFRVKPDLARLAELLTGDYDVDELLGLLGPRWSESAVLGGIARLQQMNLIDDGERHSFSARRFQLVPPMTVQLSVVDPSRVLPRIAPAVRALTRRPVLVILGALIAGGLLALGLAAGDVRRLISTPIPAGVLALVIVGGFLGTVVHEFAHAATLAHYGGRPHRMGVMLFYLLPSFFCDVSDGWLLPNRMQRVRVALAGIFAQLVFAGTAGITGVLLPAGPVRDALLLLTAVTYLAAIINLLPFVKLDGYLALMAWCDTPNLRAHAIADARNFLAVALYGARRHRTLRGRWIVPYGLVCMAFPLYLVGGVAFNLWSQTMLGVGVIGALLVLALLGGLVFAVLAGFARILRAARTGGARLPRMIAVSLLVVAGLAAGLQFIKVPEAVPAYYRTTGGELQLLVATSAGADALSPGMAVELRSDGVVHRQLVGAATITGGEPGSASVPLSGLLPLTLETGLTVEVTVYPMAAAAPPRLPAGTARVRLGDRPVWAWLYARYVAPVTGF
ncbi:daptide biosynthesis intramembrane metalloprotease [Rhizomonospora bruguierae]|uniref:daptide biosynthesis intramembrane metalloprotease n=1 Tax=Rhizomonospora bruguierae TaxID=1581705 RepID=UPI00272E5142|nr:daptide biosynthesis intramembrane metalloprotease [Micromonospora sp. NBRC 107566]